VVTLDTFALVFLVTAADPPEQTEDERAATQDAHLAHLADMHEAGELLAAGPVLDPARRLRGICIFACEVERARSLLADDPAVRAGWFDVEAYPWLAPRGALASTDAPFPRSAADAG